MRTLYAKFLFAILTFLISSVVTAQISVTASAGTAGPSSYTTLKAAFDAINSGTHKGDIIVTVNANTTETAQAVLNKSGTGSSAYTSVMIKPGTGVTATITGNNATSVVTILGSNVTIDGSNNGSSTRNLTIANQDTSKLATLQIASQGAQAITNVTVKNTVIRNAFAGVLVADTTGGLGYGTFTNISIQNNSLQTANIGVAVLGKAASGNGNGLAITGNDLSSSGNAAIYNMGVYVVGVDGAVIASNNIGNFNGAESQDDLGIVLDTGTKNIRIEKNKIFNLGYTGTQGYGALGMDIETGTLNANVTVANNMIANIFGDGWDISQSLSDNPMGIFLNGTQSGINFYYNSIYLSGSTLNQTNAASFGIFIGPGTVINMLDNIIVNNLGTGSITGSSTVGIYVSNITQLASIDYNDYYINPTLGTKILGWIGSTTYASLAAWQTGTGQESHSKNVSPVFASTTDLHLIPGSNNALDNSGTPVAGITTDFDGDARSGTNPDMGADEFTSTGVDQTPPTISFTALTFTCGTGDRNLTNVVISDAGGVPTTGANVPRIYYKKSTGSTWFSRPGTLTSGSSVNGTWSFTIAAADLGTLAANDVVQYYVIAQDNATTPNLSSSPSGAIASGVNSVTTPPTTPASYTISGSLSGTYTVGAGGNYTTLTAAVNAYNNSCLGGPVVFSLISSTYTGETLPIVINANASASATNTLTIKPAAGVNATLADSSSLAIIQLKGADYVTIDGSNTVNGTTRNLTITNTKALGSIAVIWITPASASDGANNNTIKNVNLTGKSALQTAGAIVTGSYTSPGNAAETANSNNTISNNAISRVGIGLYAYGTSAGDQNWTVSNNNIGSTTTSDKLSDIGVFVVNTQNFSINNNTIGGVKNDTSSTASGILVGGNVSGGTIYNNKISDIKNTSPTGYGSNGIFLLSSNANSNISVYNNFVSDIASYGYANNTYDDNGYGIVISNGGGYSIYYNTVLMNTNQTNVSGLPAAFNIDTATGPVIVKNNLFINTQTVGTERYSIISSAPNSILTIDYNDYYTAGPDLGYNNGNKTNLAAIQSGFGGNQNSKSVLPVFVSATDLHLAATGNTALQSGTPITGITTDIDGNNRSATATTMGADEITTTCVTTAITTQPAPVTACQQTAATFTVVATGTNLTYQWSKDGTPISGATNATYSIASLAVGNAGQYSVLVTGSCGTVTSNVVTLTVNTCTGVIPVDADIQDASLLPNIVHASTTLRVKANRPAKINWEIIDAKGSVVAQYNQSVQAGANDLLLHLDNLSAGVYRITGGTAKGKVSTLQLIKL